MMVADRKGFKSPPAALTSATHSQAARRAQALEEQRRRREQRFDSSRGLDILSNLNLGLSDAEDGEDNPEIVREGVSQFASMLPAYTSSEPLPPPGKKRGKKRKNKKKQSMMEDEDTKSSNKKHKSQWADKCMYAELLEMKPEIAWEHPDDDGLPDDLESNWIAVGGIPVGKRCLAVTYHSSGVAGSVPNTTLRSRLVGKQLMPPFPSILPSNTVLDCVLDENWQLNGILHVLDALKWKGQDIADCETAFRFWWRDTRMSELLTAQNPPSSSSHTESNSHIQFNFPHPTTFVPIPYFSDTSLSNLLHTVIPSSRLPRVVLIATNPTYMSNGSMDVDVDALVPVEIKSEGLLLYVAQATYEPGQSPLSSWIPITFENANLLDTFERLVKKRLERGSSSPEVEMDI